MALGDLLAGATQALPAAMPAATVQQPVANIEENKGLWKQFLTQVSDPNFRQAAFTTGLNFLRTPQVGQSGWDVGANALGAGFNTLGALRERDRVQEIEAENRRNAAAQQAAENEFKGRQVSTSEKTANIYGQATEQQAATAAAAQAGAAEERKETALYHRDVTKADMIRANAAMIAAMKEGRNIPPGQDISKIAILSKKYMKDYGMDQTDADAAALREIETKQLEGAPRMIADEKDRLQRLWQADPKNLRKEYTDEINNQLEQMAAVSVNKRLADEEKKRRALGPGAPKPGVAAPPPTNAPAPPAAPTGPMSAPAPAVRPNPAPGGAAPVPQPVSAAPMPNVQRGVAPPPAPGGSMADWAAQAGITPTGQPLGGAPAAPQAPDPTLVQQIQTLQSRGVPPERIKAQLAAGGINPALYGL